ncbi:hypothetical protein HID58_095120 [Brassica napus]|uniref:Uncharacterized protein n=1 Tax=Brassica napus TaxID=3708 RepID=A0ABQ7X4W3_BRANA|nr:hypothetical protein HID58_095120 [Brassica napus]
MRSIDHRLMEESSSLSSSHYFSIFTNYPLLSAVLAFTIAQFIKFFTTWYKEKRWDLKRLVGSGGMPSITFSNCYSSCYGRWFTRRLWRISFRYAFILTSIVMCDATGVRLHAGRQAEVFLLASPAESRPLRELLGHTPPQVIMGGILGTATAVVGYLVTLTAK